MAFPSGAFFAGGGGNEIEIDVRFKRAVYNMGECAVFCSGASRTTTLTALAVPVV